MSRGEEERTTTNEILNMNYKITIRPSDRLMSKYVKLRDNGVCQYRFKCFGEPGVDCSHFQKRGKETVRHDPLNVDLACRKCHWFVENDPVGQKTLEEWKLAQLGQVEYNKLILRANTTGKRDDVLAKLYVQELLKDLIK